MEEIKTSKDIRQLMRFMDSEDKENISQFYSTCLSREYRTFDDPEMALMSTDSGSYSNDMVDVLTNYSGYNYRRINAAAMGIWDYDRHGNGSERERFSGIARDLKTAIHNNQRSMGNIKAFRGVPLSYFSNYGISSLDELEGLRGGFLFDRRFVSTSLVDDRCYYKKENDLGLNYNVKIEYLLPEEFTDGISIGHASYSPGQCEYLINSWNLAQVVDVKMDGPDGAVIQAMMIPKHIYDKGYRHAARVVK